MTTSTKTVPLESTTYLRPPGPPQVSTTYLPPGPPQTLTLQYSVETVKETTTSSCATTPAMTADVVSILNSADTLANPLFTLLLALVPIL